MAGWGNSMGWQGTETHYSGEVGTAFGPFDKKLSGPFPWRKVGPLETPLISSDIKEEHYVNFMSHATIPLGHVPSKDQGVGASLVAQWLRICLPMQGTRVRALVWEDPTCHGATGPVNHSY